MLIVFLACVGSVTGLGIIYFIYRFLIHLTNVINKRLH